MLQRVNKYFILLLLSLILWCCAYSLPAMFIGLIFWDHNLYMTLTTNPLYMALFGIGGGIFAVIAIIDIINNDYV